jgi:hypothetical protein
MIHNIESQANTYEAEFLELLTKNEKFSQAIDKLAHLEYKAKNFDHLGQILNIRPKMPIIDNLFKYSENYKKFNTESNISDCIKITTTIINQTLDKTRPNSDNSSTEKLLAYELFLTKIKNNFVLNNNHVDTLITKIQIAIKSKNDSKLESIINDLRIKHGNHQNKMKEYKETKEKLQQNDNNQNIECFIKICQGINQFTTNKDIRVAATIGQAAAQISLAYKVISEMTKFSLNALVDPVTAIATSIFSIVSLFKKNKSQTANPNKMIMDALRVISEQVYQLHERFDRIEEIIGKTCEIMIKNFMELRKDNMTIKKMLENIQNDIKMNHIEIKNYINTLSNQLKVISNRQMTGERQNRIGKLFTIINKITGPYSLDENNFKDTVNTLKTEILNLHPNDIFLVGSDSTMSNNVKAFEDDIANPFCADFNLMPFYRHVSVLGSRDFTKSFDSLRGTHQIENDRVINPLLWCWQALSLLTLFKRRYEQVKNPEHCISKTELNELKQVFQIGIETHKFIVSLCDIKLFETLLLNYQNSCVKLKDELVKFVTNEEQKITNELDFKWKELMDKTNAVHTDQFKSFDIPISTTGHPNWFEAYVIGYKLTPANDACPGYKYLTHVPGHIQNFINNEKNKILNFKNSHIQINNTTQYSNSFHLFSNSSNETNKYYRFLFPETNNYPILPMLSGYKIADFIKNAEWFGIGHIVFTYVIIGTQFVIHIKLHIGSTSHLVNTITIPYNPLCFTGVEAVWKFWVEGNYCSTTTVHHVKIWAHPQCAAADLNIPSPSNHIGARNSISYDQNGILQGATETGCAPEIKLIIENKINNYVINQRKQLAQQIRDKIKQDSDVINKAIIDYSYHFYMLQSFINLLFRDCPEFSTLKFFHNEESILRNRTDWLSLLESYTGNEESFDSLIGVNLTRLTDIIDKIKSMLSQSEINYDLLNITINEFSKSIEWYNDHTVDENSLVTKLSNEQSLKEQNDLYRKLLQTIGSAVISVTNPTQQKEILAFIQENLKQQSVEIPNNTINSLLVNNIYEI